ARKSTTRCEGPWGHAGTRHKALQGAMSSEKADPQTPFWRRKAMTEMTRAEWESLCDGCGRCCLNKLIDEDTNATVFTDVSCKLLDCQTCRCSDYTQRQAKVKDCVRLTPRNVRGVKWLPQTCAYRLGAEGKALAGGIRSFRATLKQSTPPASQCGDASQRARPTCPMKGLRNISSAGRESGRREPAGSRLNV